MGVIFAGNGEIVVGHSKSNTFSFYKDLITTKKQTSEELSFSKLSNSKNI